MTKKELANLVAEKTGTTKKDALVAVEAVVEAMAETLSTGEEVSLHGFGKFVVTETPERTGTIQMGDNKGQTYTTPAHNVVKFKPAAALKEAVL